MTHGVAIRYLEDEVKRSVKEEMKHIISPPYNAAFYAGVRFLFAEVEYLAKLYWGLEDLKKKEKPEFGGKRGVSKDVVRYMRKFGILVPTAGVHYEVFRHGLTHTHMPKFIRKGGKVVSWYLSNAAELNNEFGICIPRFRDQILAAIDRFVDELESEKRTRSKTRLKKFLAGYCDTATVLTKQGLRPYARGLDFREIPNPQ